MAKTAGAVLRAAARLVESGRETFSCRAIGIAAGVMKPDDDYICETEDATMATDAGRAFSRLLGRHPTIMDFEGPECDADKQEAQNHRVMALCFAAAISDSENREVHSDG